MLELLEVEEGDNVLDIGSGSAWTTALLSKIVGENGRVTNTEIIPELLELGSDNLKKYQLKNVESILSKKGAVGIKGRKFDRILVSASSEELPEGLIEQLENGGTLVIPIKDSIWRIQKDPAGGIGSKEYPGFAFVPLK